MLHCSFCAKSENEVRKLVAGGAGGHICDACVAVAARIVDDSDAAERRPRLRRRIASAIARRIGRVFDRNLRARISAA